jgi:hypothetical protein
VATVPVQKSAASFFGIFLPGDRFLKYFRQKTCRKLVVFDSKLS